MTQSVTVDPIINIGLWYGPNMTTEHPMTARLTGGGCRSYLLVFKDEVWEVIAEDGRIQWYEVGDEYRLRGSYDESGLTEVLGEKFVHTLHVRRKADEEYARQQRYEQYLSMREEFDPEFKAQRQSEREDREVARKQSLEMLPDLKDFREVKAVKALTKTGGAE
jgi:hypothetical protein